MLTKNCQNEWCQTSFVVSTEDQKFYEQIEVPLPKFCSVCRQKRRLAFRNEKNLHFRKCDCCGKTVISFYKSKTEFPVYCQNCWWSDRWDAADCKKDFDFKRSFFDQFFELWRQVPKMGLVQQGDNQNSKFCNCTSYNKNCHLIFSSNRDEDCLYGKWIDNCRDCVDNYNLSNCELAYDCVDCVNSHKIIHSQKIFNSSDIYHSYDCRGCDHLFACAGLRNQKFCILNKKVSEKEFEEFLQNLEEQKKVLIKFRELLLSTPRIFADFSNSENFSGSYLNNCKNTYQSWDSRHLEDCKFCGNLDTAKNCYDVDYYGGTGMNELIYECEGVGHGVFRTFFSKLIWGGASDVYYSYECFKTKNCFGCTGLRGTEFSILNKQYSKEEYFKLREKIIKHMKKTGEWGQFFPVERSPFAYNESVAQEYFPLTKKEILTRGWRWQDDDNRVGYDGPKTEIPEKIEDVLDTICEKILVCEISGKNYKITPQELSFYRRLKILIPRRCPDQRHLDRVARRNPRQIWNRECQKCKAKVQTTYAPNRLETIYCEKCYLATIY